MFGNLFGAEMPLAARFVIAFVVVLALIGVTAWVVRRFGANRLGGNGGRGRQQPRLAVIDAANVDGRRKLVLIRRDNIEHLLMIGGPSDVVIEPNIVRAAPVRESLRDTARFEPEISVRAAAALDTGWPLQPVSEPAAPAAARAPREENWHPPEQSARAPRPENISGLTAELSSRLAAPTLPPQAVATPRPEPRMPAPSAEQDRNLAEMAQQLEAALRQPGRAAETPAPGKPVDAAKAPREIKMRIDPRIEARGDPRMEAPKVEPRPEPKPAPRVEPVALAAPAASAAPAVKLEPRSEIRLDGGETKPQPLAAPKTDPLSRQEFYDNLEEEMASLLGRPPGKS